MVPVAFILADADANVVKVIFGIVVFLIWGVAAVSSALRNQKKQERLRQRQMEEELEREMQARRLAAMRGGQPHVSVPPPPPAFAVRVPPAPPPVTQYIRQAPVPMPAAPQQPMARPPVMARPPAAPRPAVRKAKQAKCDRRPEPPTLPLPAQYTGGDAAVAPAAPAPPSAPVGPRREPAVSANAAALHRWLSAGTLRSQFILTEILQPPLALRESRD